MTLASSLEVLRDRADMLATVREFFKAGGLLEVDCPLLNRTPSCDAHIDPIVAGDSYLHTSPEYAMKRLLAKGCGDIYQLGHVFRDGEVGHQHNPEFTLVEWYRVGIPFEEMIAEGADFIALFIGDHPLTTLTYRQAFQKYAHLDPFEVSTDELKTLANHPSDDRDDLLNIILALHVEPGLAKEGLLALTHYPASQAALARTTFDGPHEVASRFEIYFNGIELANGYHELNDTQEQRGRFHTANRKREQLGKSPLPLDEPFLACLDTLPDCCGIAIGFDRLMMLRHSASNIAEVLPIK